MKQTNQIPVTAYKATGFIKKYQDIVRNSVIPYQYSVLWDMAEGAEKSHVAANFINAARALKGKDIGDGFYGMVFQGYAQRLFVLCREGGQHPVRQIVFRVGLGAHTDLHPGKVLTAQLLNDGLDAVVPPGGAICPHPQPPRLQRNVVKHDDDILRRDFEEGGQLQYRPPGQVHIGLGFQQKQLDAVVGGLVVKSLKFQFIDFDPQILGQNVQRPEAAVVAGALVFLTGIAKAHNEPAFGIVLLKQWVSSVFSIREA